MIPVRLKLRDFLSYGQPEPVDFTGFEVACLTGANGVGKSSLLDAMTWAVWGSARGCEGGQHQDRVIRDGAEEAMVEFTFDLGDERYRITRRRSRAGKADLRFVVRDGESWTNLAADTLKETDGRISHALRMDYRTFITSAFFLQGRADDFVARMDPKERKDVFARLLDLGAYDALADEARRRAREAARERDQLSEAVERLRPEAERLDAVQTQLEAADRTLVEVRAADAAAEKALDKLSADVAALERTEAQAAGERQAVAALSEALDADRRRLDAALAELKALDELLSRTDEVTAALAEVERLTAEEADMRQTAERRSDIERRLAEARRRLDTARERVSAGVHAARQQADAKTKEIEKLEAARPALDELTQRLESLGDPDAALDELRQQLGDLRSEHAALGAQIEAAQQAKGEIDEKIALLAAGEGTCPTCGTPLDAAHRKKATADAERELAVALRTIDELTARREVVHKEGLRLKEEETRLRDTSTETQRLRTLMAEIKAQMGRIPSLRTEVEALLAKAATDEVLLREDGVATEDATIVRDLRAELESLAYDPGAHERLRVRLRELAPATELKGRLEEAGSRRTRVLDEQKTLVASVAGSEEALAKRTTDLQELEGTIRRLPEQREALAAAREERERTRTAAATGADARARLAEQHAVLTRAAQEFADAHTKEKAAADRHRVHTRLATAFGRGGIPDRIIENALPELTQEANDALGRLSDYEMSVQFVMDKLTKSGTVKETFDVLVHHDGGVRDFQMFSGGEAFRIAFAVRLGLSKLLVRRAGARVETLVIDEGFGTQDPAGRERLVEAINLARSEFRKVIVITHLDELKDAFGTQLRVTKDSQSGSTVELLGS